MLRETVFIINHDKKIFRMDSRSDEKIPKYDKSKVEVTGRKGIGDENRLKAKLRKDGYVLTDISKFKEFEI